LFQHLSPADLDLLCAHLEDKQLPKGEVLCGEGEPGDALYVVARGELEVRTNDQPDRVLRRMGPGEFVGEIALLLGGLRTATVTAARPSRLLVLRKDDFQRLFGQNAAVLEYVSRILAKRLAAPRGTERPPQLAIAVLAREGVCGRSLVAASLGALIHEFTGQNVLLVAVGREAGREPGEGSLAQICEEPEDRIRGRSKPQFGGFHQLSATLSSSLEEPAFLAALDRIASKLCESFATVVFDLCTAPVVRLDSAAQVSDVLVEVSDGRELAAPKRVPPHVRHFLVVNRYHPEAPSIPVNHCEPFVLRPDLALLDLDASAQAQHVVRYPRSVASPPLRRLARKILGSSVGVALGGGAAFGIAHVGVFQVLEANGIEVDLLAGTSMGSIVALGYAAGLEPNEMYEIARRIGNKRTTLSALDFTLTRPGLLAGDRLVAIFSPLLGSVQRFEELVYPCRTVAADIESGERVCIGDGALSDAFRASCSVPMLWSPVRREGRTLVDGGMVDPLPAEVVNDMGADVCIAVNAVPALRQGVDTVLSRWYRRLNTLNPLSYLGASRELPSTFDTVMNAIQVLQHELGKFKAISADVQMNPDLADFTWIEFYRPLEIIERGARAAEEALPAIRNVLAERLQRTTRVQPRA
jgi:NTE family protein